MFHPDYPVTNLRPAPYNPRHLDDDAFAALQRSIHTLGMVKPIIASDTGTIVAGHQRIKAVVAMGATTAPVYILHQLNLTDELLFNQLHNGTDLDMGDEHVTVPPSDVTGYVDVPSDSVRGHPRARGATMRHALCGLLTLYGPWGGIVATKSGVCLSGAQYALCCRLTHTPVRVFYVDDKDAPRVRSLFQKQYGTFCYTNLPKTTYAQTFAQLYRIRPDANGTPWGVRAPNYDKVYIPGFREGERILDFGCGQADYVRMLQDKGVRIWGLEFFYRIGMRLNTAATHQMIDSLIAALDTHGRFDTVICEFVLNSTDSVAAEAAVMTCLNAFCRPGGRIYASGRTREAVDMALMNTSDIQDSGLAFLDANGHSAKLNRGQWFYQMYHTKAQCQTLGDRYLGPDHHVGDHVGMPTCFLLSGVKQVEIPADVVEAALEFEFNLMWPEGQTVNRHREIIAAWRRAMAREQTGR